MTDNTSTAPDRLHRAGRNLAIAATAAATYLALADLNMVGGSSFRRAFSESSPSEIIDVVYRLATVVLVISIPAIAAIAALWGSAHCTKPARPSGRSVLVAVGLVLLLIAPVIPPLGYAPVALLAFTVPGVCTMAAAGIIGAAVALAVRGRRRRATRQLAATAD